MLNIIATAPLILFAILETLGGVRMACGIEAAR